MARRPPPRRPSKAGQKPSAGSSREPSRAKQAASSISTEQVARAKDFFRQFEVALKNAALYSHTNYIRSIYSSSITSSLPGSG